MTGNDLRLRRPLLAATQTTRQIGGSNGSRITDHSPASTQPFRLSLVRERVEVRVILGVKARIAAARRCRDYNLELRRRPVPGSRLISPISSGSSRIASLSSKGKADDSARVCRLCLRQRHVPLRIILERRVYSRSLCSRCCSKSRNSAASAKSCGRPAPSFMAISASIRRTGDRSSPHVCQLAVSNSCANTNGSLTKLSMRVLSRCGLNN